jgi:hypothetical protein
MIIILNYFLSKIVQSLLMNSYFYSSVISDLIYRVSFQFAEVFCVDMVYKHFRDCYAEYYTERPHYFYRFLKTITTPTLNRDFVSLALRGLLAAAPSFSS